MKTITVITDAEINSAYDVAETLSISSALLANGNVTDNTAGSISWLLGSMGEKVSAIITLLETVRSEQEGAQP